MYEILKAILSPCGLIWIGLIVLTWPVWRTGKRKLLAGTLVLLVAYTLLGNYWIACQLSGANDSEYRDVDPWAEGSYDVVCVLGGGISMSSNGHLYLNQGGDRIMLGARLYFRGRTGQLIATGESRSESTPDPADCCFRIWRELNIPEDHITRIGGRDTVEELEEIQRVCEEKGWKQIGLVTSANHLPRAMAYAEKIDLNLHPLPAGNQNSTLEWNYRKHLIPGANGFLLNQYFVYEVLGKLIQ
ncbi:MAG: YdcF family protein [Planctomycetales bacterium]|jgi:uncharacterized SAM-binding protein YcdF (DUF218 family)